MRFVYVGLLELSMTSLASQPRSFGAPLVYVRAFEPMAFMIQVQVSYQVKNFKIILKNNMAHFLGTQTVQSSSLKMAQVPLI